MKREVVSKGLAKVRAKSTNDLLEEFVKSVVAFVSLPEAGLYAFDHLSLELD